MISVDTVGRWTLSVMVQEGRCCPFSLFESLWIVDALIWQIIGTWNVKVQKILPRLCRGKNLQKKMWHSESDACHVFLLPWRSVLDHTVPPQISGIGKHAKRLRTEIFINLELFLLKDWQIGQILTERSIRDVRSRRVSDCDTDHFLVVAQVRERLAERTFDVERFSPQKLSELEVRKQYQIVISDRYAALEKLNDGEYTNWKNIKKNRKIWTTVTCISVWL